MKARTLGYALIGAGAMLAGVGLLLPLELRDTITFGGIGAVLCLSGAAISREGELDREFFGISLKIIGFCTIPLGAVASYISRTPVWPVCLLAGIGLLILGRRLAPAEEPRH
jgi:hypothetical protein